MSKFIRTDAYMQKLFEQAMFDDKKVIQDAHIIIRYENGYKGKLKAYCEDTKTYLQFPTDLRGYNDQHYQADVIEVLNDSVATKYYRVMKGSIRLYGYDEVVA